MGTGHITKLALGLSATLALSLASSSTGTALADPANEPYAASGVWSTTGEPPATTDGGSGEWSVVRVGDRSYEISWASPERLPVTDDRPEITLGGVTVGATTVARNGRTVTVPLVASSPPRVGDLDVVLSGEVLDESAPEGPVDVPDRHYLAPRGVPVLDVDPGVGGANEITSSDYTLPGFLASQMPRRVEMVGHVVRPADGELSEDAPLVLFLHGRHEFCYNPGDPDDFGFSWPCRKPMRPVPSQLGFDYVQRLLASQGYVTVSIAANGINAQDDRVLDSGAQARAQLVRRHLEQWATWAQDGTYRVDMDNVVLVGHSRGGEGVNRASLETPLDASYRVTGQVLLAPTNFTRQTTGYVPTVTVLPYCDGDVIDLQGQAYTDLARDLADDDTSLKSSVLVLGANHNFFNTEWTPGISAAASFDDYYGPPRETCGSKTPQRLSAFEQRKVGKAYIAGAVHLMTGSDPSTLPMFDGSRVRVASGGNADVRTHAIGGGRVLRRPGIATRLAPAVGAATLVCSGYVDTRLSRACGRESTQVKTPHWIPRSVPGVPTTSSLEMSWNGAGQRGGLTFDRPLDAGEATYLDLRTVVDPRMGHVRVKVRLVDRAGQQVTVTPTSGGFVAALPRGRQFFLGKLLAQTLRVPLEGVNGVDLRQITEVDLVGESRDGHVWVLDIAAVPPGPLPGVPDRRLPQVNLGRVRLLEGNQHGRSAVDVPFTVVGKVVEPARFVVTGFDEYDGRPFAERVIVVQPGKTSGTVRYEYRANRIDDVRSRGYSLTAFPLRNVMTRESIGAVRIIDDDPRPRLVVRRTPTRQVEGKPMTWTLTLSKPVGYDFAVDAPVVAGRSRGPVLRVGDLRRGFAERHGIADARPTKPLYRSGLAVYTVFRRGRTTAELRVPTRPDGTREPTESLTLRILAPSFRLNRVSTGYLKDTG